MAVPLSRDKLIEEVIMQFRFVYLEPACYALGDNGS